jgi:hypothetical protein
VLIWINGVVGLGIFFCREDANARSHSAGICPEKQFFVNILCRQSLLYMDKYVDSGLM